MGTHIDAPNHFAQGAPAVDEIPLSKLSGPGYFYFGHHIIQTSLIISILGFH